MLYTLSISLRSKCRQSAHLHYIAVMIPVIHQSEKNVSIRKQLRKENCITTNFYSEAHRLKKFSLRTCLVNQLQHFLTDKVEMAWLRIVQIFHDLLTAFYHALDHLLLHHHLLLHLHDHDLWI